VITIAWDISWYQYRISPDSAQPVKLAERGHEVTLFNRGVSEPDDIAAVEQLLTERAPDELGHDPVDLNTHRFASGEWRAPFAGSAFGELREARLANPQTLDRAALVAFFESMGWLGDIPAPERLPLLDQVRSLLDADEYRRSWETRVYWTHLGADASRV
jgi:hypothetical protein